MRCTRLGHIYSPRQEAAWLNSHAANPIAVQLQGDLFRVYFSSRDQQNKSHIGSLVLNVATRKVEQLPDEPVLSPGAAGFFDDSGVTVGCMVANGGSSSNLYYLGWNMAPNVPFRNSIGLAVSNGSEAAFEKFSEAPILDRNLHDPLTLSYPWVLKVSDGWRMWYGSHKSWATDKYEMIHVLNYAQSDDGIHWKTEGAVQLAFADDSEFAVSRPCILHEDGIYKMWFSSRGKHYRINYAESEDGLVWRRQGSCLEASGEGWDSQSVEYASVFDAPSGRYMLYCGDGYGKTGFGLAAVAP